MTDDELYEAFEKAFPEAEDYAKTYAHIPLDRYKAPYDDMFEGFDAGVRVVEERITALEERLELWAEDGEGKGGVMVMSYKGFDSNLKCRDFQFEVGKTYTHTGVVKACESGFHACEYALDVFSYYAPGMSRYAEVEQTGEIAKHDDDSKVASSRLTIRAEIGIIELVKAAVEYTISRCSAPDPKSPATNTGHRSAATNTGDRSAATNTGTRSAATNTGYQSAASVEGPHSVALSAGLLGRAKASEGSAIVLVDRGEDGVIRHIRCAIAGQEVKADTWYTLNDLGEFEEVENV